MQQATHPASNISQGMNLRERLAALRSRRTLSKSEIPLQLTLASPSPKGTPTKANRLHSEAARRQWHQQQLNNAAKRARQNVVESGLYDFLTSAPPPEAEQSPLVKEERQAVAQDNESEDESQEGEQIEIDEEQMEIYEEERVLQHTTRQLLFDDNSTHDNTTPSAAQQPQGQSNVIGSEDNHAPHSSANADVRNSAQVDHPKPQHIQEPSTNNNSAQGKAHDPQHLKNPNTTQASSQQVGPLGKQQKALDDNRDSQNKLPAAKAQARPAPVQDTSPQSPEQSVRKTVTKKSARVVYKERPPNPLGMVDDEADEGGADDSYGDGPVGIENEGMEDEGNDDCFADEQVSPSATDKNKLAQFHRNWQLNKEKNELAVAAAGGVLDDIDEAVDLTDLMKKERQCVKGYESENDGSISGAGQVPNEADETRKQSELYMEQMFQRDESRSRIVNEFDEDSENEQKREKARALWKARQKAKARRQRRDNDSLSQFDLFDSQSISRSADFRHKLEKACRHSTLQPQREDGGRKRKNPWSMESTLSNWEKQLKCMQSLKVKKRKGVPVSNWSFAVHGNQEKISKKSAMRTSTPSLGASCVHSRSRSRHVPVREAEKPSSSPRRQAFPSASRGPTSFKGLLTLLGKSAETSK